MLRREGDEEGVEGRGGENLKESNTFFFSVEQIASAPPCVC